jgi:hypothetical protein
MTRTDERLADLQMIPVECARCGAVVRVRKSSWEQTSIQWDATGVRTCVEQARPVPGNLRPEDFITCPGLYEAINRGALSGEIPLADEDAGESAGGGATGAAAEERAVPQ